MLAAREFTALDVGLERAEATSCAGRIARRIARGLVIGKRRPRALGDDGGEGLVGNRAALTLPSPGGRGFLGQASRFRFVPGDQRVALFDLRAGRETKAERSANATSPRLD
jgi:hypothetical protein